MDASVHDDYVSGVVYSAQRANTIRIRDRHDRQSRGCAKTRNVERQTCRGRSSESDAVDGGQSRDSRFTSWRDDPFDSRFQRLPDRAPLAPPLDARAEHRSTPGVSGGQGVSVSTLSGPRRLISGKHVRSQPVQSPDPDDKPSPDRVSKHGDNRPAVATDQPSVAWRFAAVEPVNSAGAPLPARSGCPTQCSAAPPYCSRRWLSASRSASTFTSS